MKTLTTILSLVLCLLAFSGSLNAVEADEVQIGFGSGANLIPFGGVSDGQPYQQIYNRTKFPASNRIEIREIAFSSNPTVGTGLTNVNVILRLATARTISTDFALNLGNDQRVVWNGTVSTLLNGTPGDLKFDLRGKPFLYDPSRGDLLLQVEVVNVSGFTGGFYFGSSFDMWRVYYPLDGSPAKVEASGLNTTFTVKVK
jgi:hypothetical protein